MSTSPYQIYESHENRIGRLEETKGEHGAVLARIDERVNELSNDFSELKAIFKEGLKEISSEVAKITNTISSHQEFVNDYQKEKVVKLEKKAKQRKMAGFILLPVTGAILASFGKTIFEFIQRLF